MTTPSSKIEDRMEIVNPEVTTNISEFFKGKSVFITGATGFLGKILVDKLLRSCPDIGNIYILVRPKKGKELNERVELMLKDDLFGTLKLNFPSQLSKIIPVHGDCSQLKLGLNANDYQTIISSVSVIYHVAASVRFDDSLEYAILLNTRGTRELAQLALQTCNLVVLVHVSTTYCNCVVGKQIQEKLYPAPADWRKAIKIAEEMDKGQLAALTDKFLGPYPNTYTFTKALGEHVIKDICEGKIPTVICRPSIVVSTLRDPVKGWIDNFNGPVGLLVACGKGLLRNSYQNASVNSDYIPVDVTVKAIVVATWDLGLRQQRDNLEVMHCSSGYHKWMSLGEVIRIGRDMSCDIPLNDSVWVPKGFITRCSYYAYFCTILFHLLPACFLDIGLKLAGKKPILMKLQMKIYNASLQLRYFTWQEWEFSNKNFYALEEKILDDDRNSWGYDFRGEDVQIFIQNCMKGARKYLLHETDETLPKAKIHYKRMYWLDKVTMFLLYGSFVWMILHYGFIEMAIKKVYNYMIFHFDSEYV